MSRKKKAQSEPRYRDGRLLCSGTSKRSGEPCRALAVKGRETCRIHGGKSPRGTEHPSTTHGRYSQDFPTALSARFEGALRDPDLLTLRREIALVDVQVGTLIACLGDKGLVERWEELVVLVGKLDPVLKGVEGIGSDWKDLAGIIREGSKDAEVWRSIRPAIESRRRLVDTETRRIDQAAAVMTMTELALIMKSIVEIIKRNVEDDDIRRNISTDIESLIYSGDSAFA